MKRQISLWMAAPVALLCLVAAACCPPPGPPDPDPTGDTTLSIEKTAPLAAFPGQAIEFSITVTNTGTSDAVGARIVDTLPSIGSFASGSPAGTPAAPTPGSQYTIDLGTVPVGQSASATVVWTAPIEGAVENSAVASADNAPTTAPATASVAVGIETSCDPCGVAAAGTGLRNRDSGTIAITDVPPGATVGRAVLVWGILYNGATPANTISLNGTTVSADLAADVSGTLCWGDNATIGYAADVTGLVAGNGDYVVGDPQRGTTRIDDNPAGTMPYTDGASLLVFYVGGGSNSQVISDFSYDTNTDGDGSIAREFEGISSVGGAAQLILAGPDGQGVYPEQFNITGDGNIFLDGTWDGSDPQAGPSFAVGNLWDTDHYDVSSVLPAGQETLTFAHEYAGDCIGVGAAVLSVSQDGPAAI